MHSSLKVVTLICLLSPPVISLAENSDSPLSIYNQALSSDPELRAAWSSLKSKREKGEQSTGALLPSVVLSGKIAANNEDVEFTTGTGTPGETSFSSHDLNLTVKQPVYRKELFSNLDVTRANIQVAETEFKVTQQNLITRVIQRYVNALGAQDKLDFASAETRALKEQMSYSQKRLDVGRSTATDYLETKAAYDLSTAEVIAASDEQDDTLDALAEMTGQTPARLAALASTFKPEPIEPNDVQYWISSAETNNPALAAARYQLDASSYEVDRHKAGHYPKLDLVARYSNEETGGRFGDSVTDRSSVALQLELPLYSGGQVSSKVRESLDRVENSREILLKTQRNVQRETRKAFRNANTAINRIRALKLAVTSSEAALSSIKSGYKAGTRSNADILNAQQELHKARLDHSAARYMYILNYVQLKNVAGMLSADDVQQINAWFK